jgi:TRAP-type transport system periplasmic protein
MRSLTTLAAGIAVGLTMAAAPVRAQAPIEINVAHVLSEQSAYNVIFARFGELLRERSNGRVTVRVQCCGAAGNEGRLIQSLRTGVIDGAFVGGSSLETVVPDFRVLSLPYLFDNNEQANRILQGPVGDDMLRLLEPSGIVGMGWGAIFERNYAGRKPVNTAADMRGLKIRVLQTPGFVLAYEALGTQPTPMALGEVFLALQNGVVDALEVSPDSAVADRFVEVITHYTLTRTHQSTTVFAMSKAKFDALPADVRTLVRTAARDAIKVGLDAHAELNRRGLQTMRERGVNVVDPDLSSFMETARRSYDRILADAPGGRALVQKINAAK